MDQFGGRPIAKVIAAVKTFVHSDFPEKGDLFYELDEIVKYSESSNVEETSFIWNRLVHALQSSLGLADTEWKRQIQLLMATKIDYRSVLGE